MHFVRGLLWGVVTTCLVAGGWLLLFACDFQKPSFLSFNGRFCPGKLDFSGLEAEQARADDLRNAIHNAEIKLAEMPNCALPPYEPPAIKDPTLRHGRLEITLWWETPDDLDLNVTCPGGTITPNTKKTRGPGICGDGIMDKDANKRMQSSMPHPHEHVVWDKVIPAGIYKVFVLPKLTGTTAPIEYHTRVDFDGEAKECLGVVQYDPANNNSYGQLSFIFTPTHPIPDCHLINQPVHSCDPSDRECNKTAD